MKFIIVGIAAVVFILILYYQFGMKNENEIFRQQTSNFKTKNNQLELEKPVLGTLKEINGKEYDRLILTKNTTESYITKAIKEYGELSGNEEYEIYNFGIAQHGDWKIIKVEESLSFYVYHNLVGWLIGYEENPEIPELSIGYAKNKTDPEEDYLFFLDPENQFGDTQIGAFRNGKSFSIYLPEAYEEYGNLTIKNEINVSMKENTEFIAEKGFDTEKVLSLNYAEHKIKMNE